MLARLQRRPQAAKAAADDEQVALLILLQRGLSVDVIETVEPVAGEAHSVEGGLRLRHEPGRVVYGHRRCSRKLSISGVR